jgi:hypothetical protein
MRCDHRGEALHRLQVGVFGNFGEELAQSAASVQGDGDDGGDRAATQDVDQDQRDDDLGDGAQRVHCTAEDGDEAGPAGETARCEKRKRHCGQGAQKRGDGGNVQRLDQRGDVFQKDAGQ